MRHLYHHRFERHGEKTFAPSAGKPSSLRAPNAHPVRSAMRPRPCSKLLGSDARQQMDLKRRQNARQKRVRMRLAQHSWNPSDQPKWITPELFAHKIQPALASVPVSVIRSSIGVSKWYAGKIRHGYRPHPRHWQALAQLVGISTEGLRATHS